MTPYGIVSNISHKDRYINHINQHNIFAVLSSSGGVMENILVRFLRVFFKLQNRLF